MENQATRAEKATIFLRVPQTIKDQFDEYAARLGVSGNQAGTMILLDVLKNAGYPGLSNQPIAVPVGSGAE